LVGFVKGIFETALASDELLRAVEVPMLPADTRWGHWKFCRKVGEFSKATACVLAVPDRAPRAVLAALDAPPLVIEDASALIGDPAAEASRLVAGFSGLTPWRRALAETALRRAVERANTP
jgi:carbon-monoxide dehydrogenase medium subunit